MSAISKIRKRNGEIVHFQQEKITEAIWNAAKSVGGTNRDIAEKISGQVTTVLEVFFKSDDQVPSVEQIQDLVEKILIENGHAKTAKAYILYREEHSKIRQQRDKILNSKGNILINIPENLADEKIHELLNLADKLGCSYKAVEPVLENGWQDRGQSPDQRQLKNQRQLTGHNTIPDRSSHADDTTPADSHTMPPRLRKMVEEVIPPPVQTLV